MLGKKVMERVARGKVMESEARRKSHEKRSSTLHAREANLSTDLYY